MLKKIKKYMGYAIALVFVFGFTETAGAVEGLPVTLQGSGAQRWVNGVIVEEPSVNNPFQATIYEACATDPILPGWILANPNNVPSGLSIKQPRNTNASWGAYNSTGATFDGLSTAAQGYYSIVDEQNLIIDLSSQDNIVSQDNYETGTKNVKSLESENIKDINVPYIGEGENINNANALSQTVAVTNGNVQKVNSGVEAGTDITAIVFNIADDVATTSNESSLQNKNNQANNMVYGQWQDINKTSEKTNAGIAAIVYEADTASAQIIQNKDVIAPNIAIIVDEEAQELQQVNDKQVNDKIDNKINTSINNSNINNQGTGSSRKSQLIDASSIADVSVQGIAVSDSLPNSQISDIPTDGIKIPLETSSNDTFSMLPKTADLTDDIVFQWIAIIAAISGIAAILAIKKVAKIK